MTAKFTFQEISVLDQLLSTIDLKALLNSAEIGFKILDKNSKDNSIYAEYENICNVLLQVL